MLLKPVEKVVNCSNHCTFFYEAGDPNGEVVIFVHGWPELSASWRHQLPTLASLGFRAIAPDMRGYGRSTIYESHGDYAQEYVVADMLALLDSLGAEKALWVGHDWGSPTVWNIASHHPDRCWGVASLCVPYHTLEYGLESCLPLVDRKLYPESDYPFGQWEYQRFYEEHFDKAVATFDADPYRTIKALFRRGTPKPPDRPNMTALVRKDGGWFGGAPVAPDVARDKAILSESELLSYSTYLKRNGFFGPCSYYMNHSANAAYAAQALNGGSLDLPVLFMEAIHDYTCECSVSQFAAPMDQYCTDLTKVSVSSGHWMAQERPEEVNAALVKWMAHSLPEIWK